MKVEDYCAKLTEWANLLSKVAKGHGGASADFAQAWSTVRFAISKSCLLARTMYCGEKPSQTPCPVHKGVWSGINWGWPGSTYSDGSPAPVDQMCQEWYDAGCRCYLHKCGCTTGWQPDEHCGCGVKP